MKKITMFMAAAVLAVALTACGSLRTPAAGPRSGNVYYHTFFGLSIESAVYGDGFMINPQK